MKITAIDGSNYFKGLLLLIRKDRIITESEIELMKRIGKTLGFEKEFCENAIKDILENSFIDDSPSVFSTKAIAEKFIRDGLRLALSDALLHPAEETWLKITVEANGLAPEWFREQRERMTDGRLSLEPMEAEDMKVEYT